MAAGEINFQVAGLMQLNQNLEALATQYGPRNAISALRPALRATLRPVADEIRRNTPVDTGTLQNSTNIRIGMATPAILRREHIDPNAIIVGRVGWFWRGDERSLWRQALSIEYGNAVTPAQSVIRPALDTLASLAVNDFAPELARSIERTTTRLGRKAAAGTLRRR